MGAGASAAGTAARVLVRAIIVLVLVILVVVALLAAVAAILGFAISQRAAEADEERESPCQEPAIAAPAAAQASSPGDGALTAWQVAALADYGLRYAGVDDPSNDQLQHATAIAMAESGWRPEAHLDDRSTGDDSYGLWQINMLDGMGPERRQRFKLESNDQLYSPKINAIAMGIFYLDSERGGGTWTEWSTYNRGEHHEFMDDAADAALDTAIMRNSDITELIDMVDSTVPPDIEPANQGGGGGAESSGTPAGCPGGGGTNWASYTGDCPPVVDRMDGEIASHERNTPATEKLRDAVNRCFGVDGGSCFDNGSWRNNRFEHPRGRACDFMVTGGGKAGAGAQAHGQAIAEWVMANADELNVLYIIWWDGFWYWRDDAKAWEEWGDYSSCGDPESGDPGTCHTNHVHVSLKLMPGDETFDGGNPECPPRDENGHPPCSE